MLFLGFSAGLPLLLIFSSLSLWLGEAGVSRSEITYFSWAALAYSFKFLWAPLVDRLPLPILTKLLGRRRGWLFLAQLGVIGSLTAMALVDPSKSEFHLTLMAAAVIALGFTGATQDIVIDAWRIESAPPELQGIMSSMYIAGYRIGMLASGAGALFLAGYLGTTKGNYVYHAWMITYFAMAALMGGGLLTTLLIKEPQAAFKEHEWPLKDYAAFLLALLLALASFFLIYNLTSDAADTIHDAIDAVITLGAITSFIIESLHLIISAALSIFLLLFLCKQHWVNETLVEETYVAPVKDFFTRFGVQVAAVLLLFIGFYRVSDIVLGTISNVFFQDLGYTKEEIASVVKTFGLFMTILGGFIGGVFAMRVGVTKMLMLGAVLTVVTNLLFMVLSEQGKSMWMLYAVISADNLTAGLASAAFVAFLSSLTNISFTAVQYAIFSSLMTLFPKLIGGYSGSIVDSVGYSNFFLIASLMGVPVILVLLWVSRALNRHNAP